MRKLETESPFIEPRFFQSLPLKAVVAGGKIVTKFETLTFTGCPYADGTEIEISASRYGYSCESLEEIKQRNDERLRSRDEHFQKLRLASEQHDRESILYNETLNIPVSWIPTIKPCLSGLTQNSAGNGWRKNSKTHVYLSDDLPGKLKRRSGSFLCVASTGYHFNDLIHDDGTVNKVDCPACLRIAKRWQQ
jgi:hypothetical protein